ncbi:MAG: hypothetical protein L6407_00435 [Candidatus Delongbacteria bacterium]|nr:hypothetical protein [Candidatus Delongbacteria bacterium]
MKKFILTALMLFTVTSYSQVAIAPLGDGSIGTPYQIETIQNLYWINQIWSSWDKYMVLNNDIDASDSQNWDGGTGWTTIGNLSTYFTGNFDGQGHTVSGVYLNRPESDFIGFFGLLSGGTVQNLGITDADISGSQNTGILCGYLDNNAQIVNCYSTGNVSGNSAGGLIGTNSDSSTITGCYSSADVDIRNGGGGGFAGSNNNGIITNCYSTGEVSDTSYNNASGLGGFIGGNANNSLINYCYSTGNVIEDSYIHLEGESAGGFASVNSTSAISNCYSKGDVIAENSTYTGGFIARNNNSSTISYCYSTGNVTVSILSGGFIGDSYTSTANYCLWDTDTSGMLTSAGGTGKTTLEMNTESTYTDAGWDFINNWDINTVTNSSYPYFQWQTVPTDPVVYTEAPAQIGSNSAVIQCDLSNLGTPVPFQHGICWNQTGNPSLSDSKTEEGIPTQAGLYNSEMTGLQSNTQYFVKAYATNTNGTFYGEEISFTSILIASTPPSSGDGSSGIPI